MKLGHAATAHYMSRGAGVVRPESVLGLGHHLLKASSKDRESRELLAATLAMVADNVTAALACPRNLYSPLVKVRLNII